MVLYLLARLDLVLGQLVSPTCVCVWLLLLTVVSAFGLSSFCAVVEMIPRGTSFHLDGCWCCAGDFVWSFSSRLVPFPPEDSEIHVVTRLHPPWWFLLQLWNSAFLLLQNKPVYAS
ncbi:unnamed protein product [Gadus morhua 'NCC']